MLVVAIFFAYASPCADLGHCHGDHVVSSVEDRAEPLACAAAAPSSAAQADDGSCHVDPPQGVMPDAQAAGPLKPVPAPVANVVGVTVGMVSSEGSSSSRDGPLSRSCPGVLRAVGVLDALCVLRI
jgi:hypothetical protein